MVSGKYTERDQGPEPGDSFRELTVLLPARDRDIMLDIREHHRRSGLFF